jgi:hypothetical protein
MKEFQPLDIARILRALDDLEYNAAMREHAIDVITEGAEVRAFILTEAGSRAWFVLNPDEHEFVVDQTPRENQTTVVTYGPTRGLLGDLVYEFSERLREGAFETILKDFLDFLRKRLGRRP